MSLYQTEKLPAPVAIDGVVETDVLARSLGVRLSELVSGYQRLWWKQAHQRLKAAVENGWRNHPYVWASTPSVYQVAHVQPADFSNVVGAFSGRYRWLFGTDQSTRPVRDCHGRPQFESVPGCEVSPPLVTYSPQQLAEALAAAARYGYWPPPMVYSSLRPYRRSASVDGDTKPEACWSVLPRATAIASMSMTMSPGCAPGP